MKLRSMQISIFFSLSYIAVSFEILHTGHLHSSMNPFLSIAVSWLNPRENYSIIYANPIEGYDLNFLTPLSFIALAEIQAATKYGRELKRLISPSLTFFSAVLATVLVSAYLYIFEGLQGSGTSIIGFSLLVTYAIAINAQSLFCMYSDLLKGRRIAKRDIPAYALSSLIGTAFLLLLSVLMNSYLSYPIHVWGLMVYLGVLGGFLGMKTLYTSLF